METLHDTLEVMSIEGVEVTLDEVLFCRLGHSASSLLRASPDADAKGGPGHCRFYRCKL